MAHHSDTRDAEDDARIRFTPVPVRAQRDDSTETRILRVITLDDGETIHNAFIDRN